MVQNSSLWKRAIDNQRHKPQFVDTGFYFQKVTFNG